jgi:hypothetical protein
MIAGVECANRDEDAAAALARLEALGLHALPVCDSDGRLAGVLYRTDKPLPGAISAGERAATVEPLEHSDALEDAGLVRAAACRLVAGRERGGARRDRGPRRGRRASRDRPRAGPGRPRGLARDLVRGRDVRLRPLVDFVSSERERRASVHSPLDGAHRQARRQEHLRSRLRARTRAPGAQGRLPRSEAHRLRHQGPTGSSSAPGCWARCRSSRTCGPGTFG